MADEGPRAVHVRIERREGRGAERVGWLGLTFLVVAVMKPWTVFDPPKPASVPPRVAAAAPATQRVAEPEQTCVRTRWSVEADERGTGMFARSAVLTDAVEASGPLDSRIRFVTVAAQKLNALGFCPPFRDALPGATATFFRLDPTATPVSTAPVQSLGTGGRLANVLYRPSPRGTGASAAQTSWPAGRYVIRIDADDGYRRWIGVDVRLVVFPAP